MKNLQYIVLIINLLVLTLPCVQAQQEINVQGNGMTILDGDDTPDLADHTEFGTVAVGGSALMRTYTIQNLGSAALTVSSITVIGVGSSEFMVSGLMPSSPIASMGSATFTVTFSAVNGGSYEPEIVIANNDTNENPYNFKIKATATGPEIDINGGILSFVTITDGDITPSLIDGTDFGFYSDDAECFGPCPFPPCPAIIASRGYGISNKGTGNLNVTSFTLTGAGSTALEIDPSHTTLPWSISPGNSELIFVQSKTGTPPGIYTATLTFNNDDANEAVYNFNIKIEVLASASPRFAVQSNLEHIPSGSTTPSLSNNTDFGMIQIGSAAITKNDTIINYGTISNTTLNVTISPTTSGFSIANNPVNFPVPPLLCGTVYVPFDVVFNPALVPVGIYNATVSISSDATPSPYTFVVKAEVTPASGGTCPTLTTAPSNVSITNSTCNSSCTVAGGTITAPSGTPCPAGSTLQYRENGGAWSVTLPTYAQTGPAQNIETRCLCDLDGTTASPISAATATVPGTCTNPTEPSITITNNVCPSTTGSISGMGCGTGTVLEWALAPTGPWSATAPSYTTTAFTVYARCRNTTTNCVSTNASAVTAPNTCPSCPTLSTAPANVAITNSTCNSSCTVAGGTITAPSGTPCPAGSTLQYRVNGGVWSVTLPTYAQTGPAQNIETRCLCDLDGTTASPISAATATAPGTCTNPTEPSITITNNVCPSTTGSISGMGCGTGTVLEWALAPTGPWSATAPSYSTTAFTVYARCRNTTTNCVSTNASAVTAPNTCPSCPILSTAPANVAITNSTCNSSCTVAGGTITAPSGTPCPAGSTLQYRVNGGVWSTALPTYAQTGPVQNIETRCLCDLDGTTASPISAAIATVPGTCTNPTEPSITITNNVCPSTTGSISAMGCGTGTVLEWALAPTGPWSATAPSYSTTAFTVYARCRNTTTNCVSTNASAVTAPNTCPSCPTLSTAPANVAITNSTCNSSCTVAGGAITAPSGTPCPAGSTLQYRVNGGVWSVTLPTYAQTGPVQNIETRCLCDLDGTTASPISAATATVPGTCTNPTEPSITITNNVCPSTTGSISAMGCGTGTVLEWALAPTGPWSATAPSYSTTAFTVYARCRNTTTNCVSTNASAVTAPNTCPSCPTLSTAPANVAVTNSTCNSSCTVAGGTITAPSGTPCPAGSTLQYRVNGGAWSVTLPTYAQTGPVQNIETRCLCDLDGTTSSPISAATATVPGTCTNPTEPSITITNNVCPSTTGSISAMGCGTGTVLEWALAPTGPWSAAAPSYTTTAFTVYARCRNTTTNCVSTNASAVTAPNTCPSCPTLSTAPANVAITNSTCNSSCTVAGGAITAPSGTPCPAGSTLQYRVNGGVWSATLPTYAQTGPVQNIETRCLCDLDGTTASPISAATATVPGTCTNPTEPSITITNNVCPSTTGSISAIGCGTGTVLEWALAPTGPWSSTAPSYSTTAFTVYARCRNTTTNCVSTNASAVTAPNTCPSCPTLSTAPANVAITNSTCNSSCTVAGGTITAPSGTPCPAGSTLQYRVNGGAWSVTLPTYAQTGPVQNIETRCLCDLDGTTASPISAATATVPGTCTNPTEPSITITNNVCPTTTGSISGMGCGTGTVLEWALAPTGPWSATAPSYSTTAFTVYARCRNTTTNCVSTNASAVTAPNTCPSCPTLSTAPANVAVTNSTCNSSCTVAGGTITAPSGTPCPAGSTLQYRVNGGAWSVTLSTYAQTGPSQNIETRCLCDLDGTTASPISAATATVPGTCTNPTEPSITITNNVCPSTTGSISGIGCGTGTVLEWALAPTGPWSATAPSYSTTAFTVYARCRNTTTNCVSTNASAVTAPNTCPSCPILSTAPANVAIINSACNSSCTVAGGTITAPSGTPCPAGSTLQYRVNGSAWSVTLPTYAQIGPAQNIETRCLCDLDGTTASPISAATATVPGSCTNPTEPSITITNNVCPSTTGSISAMGCGTGTVLEWALAPTGPWSATVPSYSTTAFTVYARCRNTTTNCVSTNASAVTAPITCATCPVFSAAPANVTIINSGCNTSCTNVTGSINAPTAPCPVGSSIQYFLLGGDWTDTIPIYNPNGPQQNIRTRCKCNTSNISSDPSVYLTTVPGTPCVAPVASLSVSNPVLTCSMQEATISLVQTGMSLPLTYTWSPSVTQIGPDMFSVNSANTYTVTVTNTNTGCFIILSTTITSNFTLPMVSLSKTGDLTCTKLSDTLTVTPATGVTYVWSAGASGILGTNQARVSAPGNYTVTVTDISNGCTASASVNVGSDTVVPIVNLTKLGDITCVKLADTLTVTPQTGATYDWSSGAASIGANQATVSAGGSYSVTVTQLSNGCTNTNTILVVADTIRPNLTFAKSSDLSCKTPVVTLRAMTTTSRAMAGFLFGPRDSLITSDAGLYVPFAYDTISGCITGDTLRVFIDTIAPMIDLTKGNDLNCIKLTDTLTVTPSSGVTYNWGTGATPIAGPNQALVSAPGLYQVTVMDISNGCTSSASINVVRDTVVPMVNLSKTGDLTCSKLTDTLTVTPATGVTYVWGAGASGILGTNQARVSAPGNYTVTVTKISNGCTASASVNVGSNTVAPVVNLTKLGDITCVKLADTLTVTPALGVTYAWNSGATNVPGLGVNQVQVTTAGTYTVTVTSNDNGCTTTASVNLMANNSAPVVNLTKSGKITCVNTSVTLLGDLLTGFTYHWSAGAVVNGQNTAMASAPGFYTVTVTNQITGCSSTSLTMVELDTIKPLIQLTKSGDLTCAPNSSVVLTALTTPATQVGIRWFVVPFGAVPIDSFKNQINSVFDVLHLVTVVDSLNGCEQFDTIRVHRDDTKPVLMFNPPMIITCTTPQVNLTVNANVPSIYAWSNQTTGSNISVGVVGTYSVTATNISNSCTSVGSVVVTSNLIAPSANLTQTHTLSCTTLTDTLHVSTNAASATYQWSAGLEVLMPGNRAVARASGNYSVTVTNSLNGCNKLETIQVLVDSVAPAFTLATTTNLRCIGDTVQITATQLSNVNYSWGLGTLVTMSANTVSVTDSGYYSLTVTNNGNGCRKEDSIRVNLVLLPFDLTKSGDLDCGVANPEVVLRSTQITGARYFWFPTPTSTTDTLLVTAPGKYFVSALFSGCAYHDSIDVSGDLVQPLAVCKPLTIYVDANGQGTLDPAMLNGGSTDDCSPSTSLEFTSSRTAFSCTDIGPAIPISLFVMDLQSNRDTCQTTVIIADTLKPVAICSSQQTLYLDALGQAQVITANINNGSNDNCGTVTFSLNPTSFTCTDLAAPTNITLTVTDGHNNQETCVTSLIVRDTVRPLLQCKDVQLVLDDATGRDTVRFGEIVTSATDNCAAIPLSYAISDSIFDCTRIGQHSTTLTVLDGQGNQTACTVQVTVSSNLNANAGPDITDCIGRTSMLNASVVGGGGTYTYSWSPNFGLSQANIPNPIDTVLASIPLILTVIDNNGCKVTDTLLITARSLPIANAGPDFSFCSNVTTGVNLQGSGTPGSSTLNYNWTPTTALSNPGIASPVAIPNSTQRYYLQVTDQFGCSSSIDSTFVTVNVSPTISVQSNAPICPGENLVLTATTSQGNLIWMAPGGITVTQTGNIITIPNSQVVAGNYNVLITAANGCTSSAQAPVTITTGVAFEAKFLTGSTACPGDTIQFVEVSNTALNGITYLWDFGDATTSTLRDPVHVYADAGTYLVSVVASLQGCDNMSVTKQVEVLNCKVADFPGFLAAKVQPNITSGKTTLSVTLIEKGMLNLEIWDMHGKRWLSEQYTDVIDFDQTLNLEREGVYFVHLRTVYGQVVLKVVVVRV